MMLALLVTAAADPMPVAEADAWAQCIWQSVPTSAANWIEMSVESPVGYQSNSQFHRLKFRLRSACWDELRPEPSSSGLIAERFEESLVREALIRTRPAQIVADRLDPQSWVCQASKGDELVAEYFSTSADRRAQLKKSPGHGVTQMNCSYILADGSLTPNA